MNTTNLISTPEITGNIGSCTTQVTSASGQRNLFAEEEISIATNSCTGQVTEYKSWEITGFGGTLIAFIFIVGVLGIWKLLFGEDY